jgi:phenylalanyl-tRNA synthetase beta subunit
MLRDIALWSNGKLSEAEIVQAIRAEAGTLLVRDRLFDVFTKDVDGVMKTSYAFNLVFQSYEKTLADLEINEIMERITKKLGEMGMEVR